MTRNLARERTDVGMALVYFFAWVRGERLTYEEYSEAMYAADDFVFQDEIERRRATWR